jgi:hypothetical protein
MTVTVSLIVVLELVVPFSVDCKIVANPSVAASVVPALSSRRRSRSDSESIVSVYFNLQWDTKNVYPEY